AGGAKDDLGHQRLEQSRCPLRCRFDLPAHAGKGSPKLILHYLPQCAQEAQARSLAFRGGGDSVQQVGNLVVHLAEQGNDFCLYLSRSAARSAVLVWVSALSPRSGGKLLPLAVPPFFTPHSGGTAGVARALRLLDGQFEH